jgi:hypothetical protein
MVMIAICSSLIGAVLGTRLKVLVLFPAIGIGVALIAAATAITGADVSAAIVQGLVLTICLQFGYLGGLLTRFSLSASRLPPHQTRRANANANK